MISISGVNDSASSGVNSVVSESKLFFHP